MCKSLKLKEQFWCKWRFTQKERKRATIMLDKIYQLSGDAQKKNNINSINVLYINALALLWFRLIQRFRHY